MVLLSSTRCRTPAEVRRHHSSLSSVPFNWEEKPGTPKSQHRLKSERLLSTEDDEHLELDFKPGDRAHENTGDGSASATAGDLFEEGSSKPLKLPPQLEAVDIGCGAGTLSATWAKSASPVLRGRAKVDDFDPAIENTEEGLFRIKVLASKKSKPLKLPPRLEVVPIRAGTMLARSDKSASPVPRGRPKVDDFDPFQRAIEKIKEDGDRTIMDSKKKKKHWKDLLHFKATASDRGPVPAPPIGERPAHVRSSVVEEMRLSSLRLTSEHWPSRKLVSLATKELVWGAFEWLCRSSLAGGRLLRYEGRSVTALTPVRRSKAS